MDFVFDEIARILGKDIPRRAAIRSLGQFLAGTVLASFGAKQAQAFAGCPPSQFLCFGAACCDTPAQCCGTGAANATCCGAGLTCCSKVCVNTATDCANCGSCGVKCAAGGCCVGGKCTSSAAGCNPKCA